AKALQVGARPGPRVAEERLVELAQLGGGLERVVVPDREASFVAPDHLLRPPERSGELLRDCRAPLRLARARQSDPVPTGRARLRLPVPRRGDHPLHEVEQLWKRLERARPEILLAAPPTPPPTRACGPPAPP